MEPWGSASLQSTASGSDHSDDLQALDHRADLSESWAGTSVSPLASGGKSDCLQCEVSWWKQVMED